MSDLVTIDIKDHVADVRLNRPEKMNAVNPAMWKAIYEAGACSKTSARSVRSSFRGTDALSAPVSTWNRCRAWSRGTTTRRDPARR